jgi:hypothetical protein
VYAPIPPSGKPVCHQHSIRRPKRSLAIVNGRPAIDRELAALSGLWRGAFRKAIEAADVVLAASDRTPAHGSGRVLDHAVAAFRRFTGVRRDWGSAQPDGLFQRTVRPLGAARAERFRRAPATLWEADLTLAYPITLGPVTVTAQAYFFNVFNNQIAVYRDEVWADQQPEGYPASNFDPNRAQTNPLYGYVTGRSEPFSFRAALRMSF